MYRIFLLIILFLSHSLNAQLSKSDSLKGLIKASKDDTSKVNYLSDLAFSLTYNNPDTAIIVGNEALLLSEKINWKKGIANSYAQLGITYRIQGDYPKALDFFLKALKIDEELKNKKGIAVRYSGLGHIYMAQANYPKALESYFKYLKMSEALGNKKFQEIALGSIGNVYDEQGDHEKALSYYFKALKLAEELGNESHISAWTGNIGTAYYYQKKYPEALEYYFKALKIDEKLQNNDNISSWLLNIGSVYKDQKDYSKSLNYSFKALELNEKLGNKSNIAAALGNIGSLYTKAPNLPPPVGEKKTGYELAAKYLYHALTLSDSINARDYLKNHYEMLSILYEKANVALPDSTGGKLLNKEEMRLRSLHYFKSFVNLRDSIFSEENKKELVRKEMTFEFDKKEAITKAEQDKKDILTKEELKQKEQERNYFIIGFALLALLAAFIFRGYRQKKKANEIISIQKHIVEEKQKEILDSIQYARRIQRSLLPTEKYIDKSLKRMMNQKKTL